MSLRYIAHVVRDRASIVGITADHHDHRVVRYGQAMTGICLGAIIHQPPVCPSEQAWLDEVLYTRLAPGTAVTLGPGGHPIHTTPSA